jgi:GT2 family glycosyltransferase
MANPDISVVIPTLRRSEELEECLDALSKQTFKNFEVIIVNNKGELNYLKNKYFNISVVQQNKEGLVSARNIGLFNAKGRIVSFIDDDVVVSESWTQEIFNTFSKRLNIGGVSGPTLIPQELIDNRDILSFQNKIERNVFWKIIGKIYTYFVLENQPKAIGRIFKSGAFSLGSNYIESTKIATEVDYLEACNMSFRKDILDNIGGFSLEYKGIGDWSEPDLAFRVRKVGYRLFFNPKAIVHHRISQQGVYDQRGQDSYQRTKNFIHFYFKWIRPNTLNKLLRFNFNLLFINLYWLYKFFKTHDFAWLLGIKGTLCGLEDRVYGFRSFK